MRLVTALLAATMTAQTTTPPAPAPKPIAPMKDFMVKILYPLSDTFFYVERENPQSAGDWMALETKALTLAEMGNLLMSPGRAYDQEQWMKDAQLLVNVGTSAYKAAQAKNLQALVGLNAELYESCQSCHVHYRPGYRRRP